MSKKEKTFFISNDDIWMLLAADVGNTDLGTYARILIHQMRNKLRSTLAIALELKPVKHRGRIRVRIAVRTVRPKSFSSHEIFQTVAIHVHKLQRVRLRKLDAKAIVFRRFTDDEVLVELDLSVGSNLFEPNNSPTVGFETCDDIVQAIAVHVVGKHLCATAPNVVRVLPPGTIIPWLFWLLPPTILLQQILPAIARCSSPPALFWLSGLVTGSSGRAYRVLCQQSSSSDSSESHAGKTPVDR